MTEKGGNKEKMSPRTELQRWRSGAASGSGSVLQRVVGVSV